MLCARGVCAIYLIQKFKRQRNMLQHLFLFFLYSCQPEVYGAGARRVRDDGQHGCAEMPGERAGGQEQEGGQR